MSNEETTPSSPPAQSPPAPSGGKRPFWKSYALPLILLASITVGSAFGYFCKEQALKVKWLGDIFLNLLYAVVVPLVFFAIASAAAGMPSGKRLFRILGCMFVVFICMGVISSSLMLAAVKLYPPTADAAATAPAATQPADTGDLGQQIARSLTVTDFMELLTKKNILALILFSMLTGLATSAAGTKGKAFADFLLAGREVFLRIVTFIMYYAPIGLAAYFAYIVSDLGTKILGMYMRSMILYYPLCVAYFFTAFTFYAYLAGRGRGVRAFWSNIPEASVMALASGSSFATIPLNLEAADRVGVPRDISEIIIPMGAQIHMDGSCLAAMLKIAFIAGLYHIPFSGPADYVMAVVVSLLSGMVMSGIPGGGFTGEVLIVILYHHPEALPLISMIGILVDPPATMANAVGDNVASMMVARILGGRRWMDRPDNSE